MLRCLDYRTIRKELQICVLEKFIQLNDLWWPTISMKLSLTYKIKIKRNLKVTVHVPYELIKRILYSFWYLEC